MNTKRAQPSHRFVYVIGPPIGLQKVGIATDPKQRLATLQTACPFDLFLHLAAAVPFGEAHTIERRAHRALAKSCVRNEWFEATPAEAMAAVQAAMVPAPVKLPTPAEWRMSRAHRPFVQPPTPLPLGRAVQQTAPAQAALPLFDFQPRATSIQPNREERLPATGGLLARIRRGVGKR